MCDSTFGVLEPGQLVSHTGQENVEFESPPCSSELSTCSLLFSFSSSLYPLGTAEEDTGRTNHCRDC